MSLIPASLAVKFSKQILLAQKNSPQLLFAGGIVGSVGSTILACKATLKLEDVLKEHQKTALQANEGVGKEMTDGDTYTEEYRRRDLTLLYVQTSVQILKLYGPAVVVGGLSIAALAKSHNIQAERIAGITAAYNVLEKAFNKYRGRVIEELGPEKDREFRHGKQTREITVTDEEGKNPKKQKVVSFGEDGPSMYARLFGPQNRNFVRQPEYNVVFLRSQQSYANHMLQSRGHVFLNDVYDSLGMERSQAGSQVGWVKGEGDGYVDFGIWDDDKMDRFHSFVVGQEDEILLDFNVQGTMWDKI